MHEFFITDKNGATKFDEPDQQKRINFLLDEYNADRESINSDLQFEFPEKFKTTYNGYQLKLLSTYSGFKVVIRVNQKNLPGNSIVYEPIIHLPNDLNIYIRLSRKNNSIDRYTNSRLKRYVPSIYFFSNENLTGPKTFPFLTNAISAFDAAYPYEQGELSSFGANDIREYFRNDGGNPWNPVKGNAFANENDYLLLPTKFNYSFGDAANITQAEFVVKDKNGTGIKKISVGSTEAMQKIALDFSAKPNEPDVLSLPGTFLFPDYIFSLEVSGSNGYAKSHRVIFSDVHYDESHWSIINIRTLVSNAQFNLLANDGFLKKRRKPSGVWDEAPIFEIPVKSRFSYWRYINDKGDALDLIPDLEEYLFKEGEVLLTKKPRPISKSCFQVQNDAATATKYLPNPINYELQKDAKERFCFDIKVPRSELFPVV
jgi:hypothetical protein